MKQFKNSQVILLLTKSKTNLYLSDNSTVLNYATISTYFSTSQHLYIVNGDAILLDDWGYHNLDGTVIQFTADLIDKDVRRFGYKKVIATTDTFLYKETGRAVETVNGFKATYRYLPKPSKEWFEHFINEYNKGNIITDVLVEYELIPFSKLAPNRERDSRLKVNPDNTINIKSTKDSWNREELKELLLKISPNNTNELQEFNNKWSDGEKVEWGINKAYFHDTLIINDWIKENL